MPDPKPDTGRRTTRRLAALGALATLPLAAQAVPAQAATAHPDAAAAPDGVINYSCGPGINPPSTVSDYTVQSVAYDDLGFDVSLRAGYYPAYSQEVAWTRVNPARSASYVDMHLDWSDDTNHSNWHICQFTGTSTRWYTPAVNAVGSRWFAAFASYANFGFYGTGWHHV